MPLKCFIDARKLDSSNTYVWSTPCCDKDAQYWIRCSSLSITWALSCRWLWNFIAFRVKVNRFLHPNEHPLKGLSDIILIWQLELVPTKMGIFLVKMNEIRNESCSSSQIFGYWKNHFQDDWLIICLKNSF